VSGGVPPDSFVKAEFGRLRRPHSSDLVFGGQPSRQAAKRPPIRLGRGGKKKQPKKRSSPRFARLTPQTNGNLSAWSRRASTSTTDPLTAALAPLLLVGAQAASPARAFLRRRPLRSGSCCGNVNATCAPPPGRVGPRCPRLWPLSGRQRESGSRAPLTLAAFASASRPSTASLRPPLVPVVGASSAHASAPPPSGIPRLRRGGCWVGGSGGSSPPPFPPRAEEL
jgi:hypothetical protein